MPDYHLDTKIVFAPNDDQHHASSVPIYQSATFKQTSLSEMGQYDYTRSGNPSRTQLENHLAGVMSAKRVLAVSSGMTALDVVCRLLHPGDEVIAGDDLYGGTHRLLQYLARSAGICVHHVDTTNTEAVAAKLNPKTRMVFLESPTNPLIKVVDVGAITTLVHSTVPSALVVFDNTMMSPVYMTPLDLGVDIQYESATKYLNGHHDVMAGVLAVRDEKLGDDLFYVVNATGCGLAPFDCWLLMRGLKTLAVRVERQQANADKLAGFLKGVPGLKLRYPGLKEHPQYELHWRQCRGAGAVLSFETGSVEVSAKIVEATKIFGISVSFGCVNSLISMPCKMSHASIDEATRKAREFPEDLIRLCVGIEHPDDLIQDLRQALQVAGIEVPESAK